MTIAELATLISILAGMGNITQAIFNIRADLQKSVADGHGDDPAPPEHVAAIKAAMGEGGSVWDEDHSGN